MKSIITLSLWVVVQLLLSYRRGFWMDEWFRLNQMSMKLFDAYFLTLRELPPYAPGEIVLGWISSKMFFFLPAEVWARIPSILFGALTIHLAFQINKKILPYLLFFSVTLTTMSTQFRSYSALIYCGAVAFILTFDEKNQPKNISFHKWFALIFGHIFGIIYISAASFFRKKWIPFFYGLFVFVGIMILKSFFGTFQSFPPAELPTHFEMLKQSLGALSNPHKMAVICAPLFGLGMWHYIRKNKLNSLLPLFIFGFSILFPIASVVIKKYFFLPRILVAAIFPFLFFVSLGAKVVSDKLKISEKYLTTGLIFGMAIAWILFIQGVPPFVDQPLHRIHLVIKEFKENHTNRILNLDYTNEGSVRLYFEKIFSEFEREPTSKNTTLSYANRVDCWKNGPCLTTILDDKFGWSLESEVARDPSILDFIDKFQFQAVIHSVPEITFNGNAKLYRAY